VSGGQRGCLLQGVGFWGKVPELERAGFCLLDGSFGIFRLGEEVCAYDDVVGGCGTGLETAGGLVEDDGGCGQGFLEGHD
jgi:hypothetical protein